MTKQNQYFPQSVAHPGATLHEKLEEMQMGPKEFALRTGKPEKTIIAVLKGDSAITSDMAVQFENVTNIPANFWLNYQRGYDEYKARERRKEQVEFAVDWAKNFPLTQMIKLGWLMPSSNIIESKVAALLSFFSMASPDAWENYYYNQELKVAFRISLAHTQAPHAISAWLRKGEIDAAKMPNAPYSEKAFKEALSTIKSLLAKQPDNFFKELQGICWKTGVKVVYTPCLNKAPICGATRWLNETPFIQLSGRHNRNDSFWFSFFHEAGHIILHGKKDIFLEQIDYTGKNKDKEQEADDFASKWLLSEQEKNEILNERPISHKKIHYFATKFKIHPAIIVGRLQHDGLIPYSFGNELKKQINLDN